MGPGSIVASVKSALSGTDRESNTKTPSERGLNRTPNEGSKKSSHIDPNEDTESDSGSDSEEESMFAYTRVAHLPPTFFHKDLVSTFLITPEVHVYGTHSGLVHLCRPDSTPIRTVRVHRASVLDISSSRSGTVVATASIDGTVVIGSINDPGDTTQASFRRPIHAIALHPDYTNQRSYISGGTAGQVVLSERSWLKSRTDTVLAQTQSTILALAWPEGPRLIWCNEDGITLYNPESRAVLSRISRPPYSPRADMYRPRIHIGDEYAVVTWHRTIYIISLKSGDLKRRIDTTYIVSGAVPFHGMRQFAVLAVEKHPELKIVDALTGQETYEDELGLHGGPRLGPNDYHLAQSTDSAARLYIVSSSDAVVARERTALDHIDWLVEHHRYTEAFAAAKHPNVEIDEENRHQIGLQAAEQAADSEDWATSAHILAEVLKEDDQASWLFWSNRFLGAHQSFIWGSILPGTDLNGVHDAVLDAAVDAHDVERLSAWVDKWPTSIYNAPRLTEKIQEAAVTLKSSTNDGNKSSALMRVLARIWLKLGDYVKTVQALVAADSPQAFHVACHYHVWTEPEVLGILGAVVSAGDGDSGDGGYADRLKQLIALRSEISPNKVVAQLVAEGNQGDHNSGTSELLLFGYLTELGQVDEQSLGQFADLVVKLYAKYDPHKLLRLFERFDTYDIDASIALCREQQLDRELVYLLGRVGQSHESLEIMVTKLHDYENAVMFARTQDPSIWDQLIDYCSEHPQLVLELLKCVEVSPVRVLTSVPDSMRIPGLKQALCKVLNDQEVSIELSTGALAIVQSESQLWTQQLRASRLKGTSVEDLTIADWQGPQLVSEKQCREIAPRTVSSFSDKIAHLKRLLWIEKNAT